MKGKADSCWTSVNLFKYILHTSTWNNITLLSDVFKEIFQINLIRIYILNKINIIPISLGISSLLSEFYSNNL